MKSLSCFNKFKKKHTVVIPKDVKVLYCDKENMITFVGPLQKVTSRLKIKLFLISSLSLIIVTDVLVSKTSTVDSKNTKKLQGTTIAQLKQILVEINFVLYHRLDLVGVGYRVFVYEQAKNQIYLKLGYSHLTYFKVPNPLKTYCFKFTKLFIFGECSFNLLTQTVAQIRACRSLELYKGKGILHDQEKIILKKSKKV